MDLPILIAAPQPAAMLRRPSAEDVMRWYPPSARAERVEGRATMRCRIDVAGAMRDCAILSETPAGYGFGEAALRLSHTFKLVVTGAAPSPEGRSITIPIAFQLPKRQR